MYHWLAGDAEFKATFDEALRDAVDVLEHEAFREGRGESVFQRGVQVGTVREYSDRKLELLLKGRKPEVYGT